MKINFEKIWDKFDKEIPNLIERDRARQGTTNLNMLTIRGDTPDHKGYPLEDFKTYSEDKKIKVVFKHLDIELHQRLDKANVVVGCVAWLTDKGVLNKLARKQGVSIIVQKEDFLRPDLNPEKDWVKNLRESYEAIPGFEDRKDFYENLSICGEPGIASVRCVGNYNHDKAQTMPRMHHKFLVFGNSIDDWYEVWTGSYNITRNADSSFENAVIISDKNIVNSYLMEYRQILALSEPLDWETSWVNPEWRIGT